jgi:hypothetical protein
MNPDDKKKMSKKKAYGIVGGAYGAKLAVTVALLKAPIVLPFAAAGGAVVMVVDQAKNGRKSMLARSVRSAKENGVRGMLEPFRVIADDIGGRAKSIKGRIFKRRKSAANDNAGVRVPDISPSKLPEGGAADDFKNAVRSDTSAGSAPKKRKFPFFRR